MEETVGTLNLKIARLEQRLQVLAQQQVMSSVYPVYQAHLAQEWRQLQGELRQLIWRRSELLSLSPASLPQGELNQQR